MAADISIYDFFYQKVFKTIYIYLLDCINSIFSLDLIIEQIYFLKVLDYIITMNSYEWFRLETSTY